MEECAQGALWGFNLPTGPSREDIRTNSRRSSKVSGINFNFAVDPRQRRRPSPASRANSIKLVGNDLQVLRKQGSASSTFFDGQGIETWGCSTSWAS